MSDFLAFDRASKRRFDANGYMHVEANPLTKVQVATYYGREIADWRELGLDPARAYHLLRPAEELEKAVPSFNGLTLLLRHEEDSAKKPQKDIRIGAVGTRAYFDGHYLGNDLSFQDQAGIDAATKDEIKEISASYRFRADMTPGVYEGQPYDGVMRDIKGNHIAIVKKGRAGADVVVNDSAEALNNKPFGAKFMTLKEKFLQLLKPFFAGAKMANDADPAAAVEQAATAAAEVVEEAVKAATAAALEQNGEGKPAAHPAAQDNKGTPPAEPAKAVEPVKDSGLTVEFIKEKAGNLLDGITEIGGKKLDEWLAALVAALAASAPAAPAMDARPAGMAFDSAAMAREIEASINARYAAKEKALLKIKGLVGEVSPLAFDSAESIYAYAITQHGLDPKGYGSAAYEGIVDGLIASRAAQRAEALPGLAHDAKPAALDDIAADLGRFNVIR